MTPETDPLVIAFVQGAKWWEYRTSGATMWPSDRDIAEDRANKMLADGLLGEPDFSLLKKPPETETGETRHEH